MTPDGHEYVFEGVVNGGGGAPMLYNNFGQPFGYAQPIPNGGGAVVQATRRIKLDLATSTVRVVESFQNPAATPLQVNVMLNNSMRTLVRSAICGPSGTSLDAATGQPMAGAAVGGVAGVNMPFRRSYRRRTSASPCRSATAASP